MVEINKNDFLKEVEEIKKYRNIDINDFEILFKAYKGEKIEKGIDITELCIKAIKDIFEVLGETWIPYNFFEGSIGKVIMSVKLGINNRVYLTSDLMEVTGFSRTYIAKEMSIGNLKGDKRPGTILFYENDVNEYLAKKGLGTISDLKAEIYEKKEEEIISPDYERDVEYK